MGFRFSLLPLLAGAALAWGGSALAPETRFRIDAEATRWLGEAEYARPPGSVSYIHRSRIKTPGHIRIGIFGPSIVSPTGVQLDQDLPSELQALFQESGDTNVEVVGFGLGGAPVQYSYLQWDQLGRPMDLDHVVLVLPRVTPYRESNFGEPPFHGRLILGPQGITKLPAPAGLGVWTRWRYDAQVPPLLAEIFPDRWRANPFYYHRDPAAEAVELTWRILRQWSTEVPHFSVYLPHPLENDLAERATRAGIAALQSRLADWGDVYLSSRGHLSALGNRRRATEIFHYLKGHDGFEDTTLSASLVAGPISAPPLPAKPISEIKIRAGDRTLGRLVPPEKSAVGIPRSWLALHPLRYLPLAQSFSTAFDGKPVWLRLTGASPTRTQVGTLRRFHEGAGAVAWKDPRTAAEGWRLTPTPRFFSSDPSVQAVLEVDGLFRLPLKPADKQMSTEPWEWRVFGIRGSPDRPVPPGQRLSARVRTTGGSIVDIPLPWLTVHVSHPEKFQYRYPWPLPTSFAGGSGP